MPVFGVPASSYVGGGVVAGPPAALRHAGLPSLTWPGKRINTVFVLGGGGNRGALQVGMLRALAERSILPDLLVGTSIGAINAASFAGEPTIEGVYLATDTWRRIAATEVFPKTRFHGTWRYFERRDAVHPSEGLRRVIGGFLRFDRIEDAPIPLVIVATRLDDGAEEWFTDGPAIDAVMASAALPGVYPVVERLGSHYTDGGVLNNVPISVAMAAKPKRVFVLLCSSVELSLGAFQRPYEAMLGAFTVNLHARLKRDLATLPEDVDVVVFEEPLEKVEMDDFSRTEELIDRGYMSARQSLDDYEAALARRDDVAARFRRAVRNIEGLRDRRI